MWCPCSLPHIGLGIHLLLRVCGVFSLLRVCGATPRLWSPPLSLSLLRVCGAAPRLWSPSLSLLPASRLWSYSAFVEFPLLSLSRFAFVELLRVCGVPPLSPSPSPASRLWSYSAFVEFPLPPPSLAPRLWCHSAFVEFSSPSPPRFAFVEPCSHDIIL